MISSNEVEQIHRVLTEKFGGASGLSDKTGLESALARPFQTFDNNELYPSILGKAAALIESILTNHPFLDGNKRIGYTVLRLFLIQHGIDLTASADSKYNFISDITSGTLKYDEILTWLKSNTK